MSLLYGVHHIVFLVLSAVILAALIVVFKLVLKTDKARDLFIRILGGVLTVSVIINRISITVFNNTGVGLLNLIPNSYCGMSNLLIGLACLFGKRDMKAFHFLVYLGFVGGIACIFYPPFINQGPTEDAPSFFFHPTITGMNHHALAVMICILLVIGKWFEPSFKRWYMFPIGMCAYTVFGLFLVDALHIPHTMNIDEPVVAGTFLTWWFILLAGSAAIALVTFLYDLIKKQLKKKKGNGEVKQTEPSESAQSQTVESNQPEKENA